VGNGAGPSTADGGATQPASAARSTAKHPARLIDVMESPTFGLLQLSEKPRPVQAGFP